MSTPTCESCNNKWSWKQTAKKMMTLDSAMICPYCRKRQYQTKKSRINSSLLTGIVTFFMIFIPNIFDMSLAAALGLLPILIAIILLIYPYLLKLSSTEQYINLFKDGKA